MRKGTLLLFVLASIGFLVSACAPPAVPVATSTPAPPSPTPKPAAAAPTPAPAAPKAARITVKMTRVVGSLSNAGLYIAGQKDYFTEEGLNVEYTAIKSLVDVIAPLSTGELDVAEDGLTLSA